MSAEATLTVGVVMERRTASSQWAEILWLPVAILPAAPALAAWSGLGHADTGERFYAGPVDLALHRTDTANYRDNLASGAPRIWIAARIDAGGKPAIVAVTADPAEGESFTEAGDDIVEHVAMPMEIAGAIAAFVAAHHVERAFVKRRRRDWSGTAPDEQA